MANILDVLKSDLGKTLIDGTSKQLGQNKKNVSSAMTTALPLILGAMKKNAGNEQGA